MYAQPLLILAIASITLTILSARMKTDVFPPSPYVYLLRFVHFYVFLFATTYIFIFYNKNLDVLFLFYCIFLVIHWQFFGDCILNLLERQHYQKHMSNIYLYTIFGKYTPDVMVLAGVMVLINFVIVIMRQEQLSNHLRIFILIAIIPMSIFQIRRQYNLDYTVRKVRLKNNN